MSKPKRLLIEYSDGSTTGVDFSQVSVATQLELAGLGVCPPPGGVGSSKHYALLKWSDGWQEVVGIDSDSVELLRYYVIRRIEDRGRLSFEVGAEYPELFIIRRTPADMIGLLIVGDSTVKSYRLDTEVERWEGTFEAGGKKEYVKYDKTDSKYPQEFSEAPESLAGIVKAAKRVLKERGATPQELLAADETQRVKEYAEVAKKLGVRGMRRQEDVYGFVEFVVKKLAESTA